MESGVGPSWLATWQAICEQEAQSKIRYKKFMEEWYRIETKMKLMDLRVDAMLRMRDEYLTHLFQKYPNWKPTFTSFGLRSSSQTPDYQSDLYRLMETEMIRSLRQRDAGAGGFRMDHPTFTQAMSASFSGPLMPTYHHMPIQRPNMGPPNFRYPTQSMPQDLNHYAMVHHGDGSTAMDPSAASQMAELKTEMGQIKTRLEDITLYLRELRHSAIELTTSVSRRSSMRDKDRRRAPMVDQGGAAVARGAYERNLVKDDRKEDSFVDEVSKRLAHEKRERNVQVVHYQEEDEDDLDSDISYHQKATPIPVQQKIKPQDTVQKPKARAAAITAEYDSPEPEMPLSKGPRFNFGTSTVQKEPVPPKKTEPKPPPQPQPPPKSPTTDDDSDSPPATATWLISGEKPKSAPTPAPAKAEQPPKAAPPSKKPVDSSPNSSPELAPKKSTSGGYQALLGTVAKQTDSKSALARKSSGSDSDDLDGAFAHVVKSPPPVAPAAKDPPPPARPRDASLSDIFNFGKSEPAKKSIDDLLSPEKPKMAPSAPSAASITAKPSAVEPAPVKKPPSAPTPAAEPDDFLKKLFPDKFAAAGAGGAGKGGSAPAAGARKKKPAFFMGDDSDDDDIDLPQGNQKSDLDDDFFFR